MPLLSYGYKDNNPRIKHPGAHIFLLSEPEYHYKVIVEDSL